MSKFYVEKSGEDSFGVYWRDEKMFDQVYCAASFHPVNHLGKKYSPKSEAEKFCYWMNER